MYTLSYVFSTPLFPPTACPDTAAPQPRRMSSLLPLVSIVQAMDDPGRIAEESADDPGDSDDVHGLVFRLPR